MSTTLTAEYKVFRRANTIFAEIFVNGQAVFTVDVSAPSLSEQSKAVHEAGQDIVEGVLNGTYVVKRDRLVMA